MDDFNAVTLDTVHAYIRTLVGFSYKTVEQHICSLRAFSVSCTRKVSCRMTLQQNAHGKSQEADCHPLGLDP